MPDPVFAVVGHPNKGKSSIVATLAHDDSTLIAPQPGTTTHRRAYPMRVDDRVLYTLVDTPGFQRARKALAWMKERESSAAEHPRIVKQFVDAFRGSGDFKDECELLTPILDGAAILYVVDGSHPYGQEYEAEMEILRWTGQPSMALINPIGAADYVDEWNAALGQYFRIVRVFNAVTAEFAKRLELLRAFGQLDESWREPLAEAVEMLERDRARRRAASARAIAQMIGDMVTLTVTKRIGAETDPTPVKAKLEESFKDRLRKREQDGRREVEAIFDHHKIDRNETEFELLDEDLLSKQAWLAWGLTRGKLTTTGAAGGAVVGGGIDAVVGGASFLLGAAIGAIVGGASAWLSHQKLADVKLFGLPMGGRKVVMGPLRNVNFPFVVLGRAIYHYALVANRTHAQRGRLEVEHLQREAAAQALSREQLGAFNKCFQRLRRGSGEWTMQVIDDLAELVDAQLADRRMHEG